MDNCYDGQRPKVRIKFDCQKHSYGEKNQVDFDLIGPNELWEKYWWRLNWSNSKEIIGGVRKDGPLGNHIWGMLVSTKMYSPIGCYKKE
jgi:hypothetical protein